MANSVTIVGRASKDPEIKYFENGGVKASFSIPINRTFSRENQITDWFNIDVSGRQAEFVGEWIKKGSWVSVTGQIDVRRYTDQAGNLKEYPYIKAAKVGFVGSKQDNAAPMEAAPAY